MKSKFFTLFALASVVGTVCAELPLKRSVQQYQRLWTDSPFTAKPVAEDTPAFNPLEDYVLLGVSPIKQGYRVTILNKKKPTDPRIVVESHKPTEGFKVVDVIREKGDPLATKVRMMSGSMTGLVGFEEKFLKIDPPKQAKPTPNNANTGTPTQNKATTPRPVRPPRIVRPATPPPGLPGSSKTPNPPRR